MTICAKSGWPVTGQSEVNSGQVKRTIAGGPSAARERHDFQDRLFRAGWLLDVARRAGSGLRCRSSGAPCAAHIILFRDNATMAEQRSAPPALPAEAPDAEEPRHVDQPRAGLFRGRHAEGALPALPRREGQGRHGADHDRRLGDRRARQPGRLRQSACLSRRDRAVARRTRRRLPRARLQGDDPAHPSRPPHRLEQGRLAAGAVGLAGARAGAPLLSEGGRGLGHRAHRRRLCERRRSACRRPASTASSSRPTAI